MEQESLKETILALKNQIVKLNNQLTDTYQQTIMLIEFIKDMGTTINPTPNQSMS